MKKWLLLSILCFLTLAVKAEPLPASEVFQVHVKKVDPNTFVVNWDIKKGYFLYRKRIKLVLQPDSNVHLGTVRFPPTLTKKDKLGQLIPIYRNQLSVPVGILGEKPGETLLDLHYQGCADDGFCYPPTSKLIRLTIDNQLALEQINLEQRSSANEEPSYENEMAQIFTHHNWGMILLIFFGLGLLLSFTPCVLPMVPVLSGIIVGHGKDITTRKAFFLSLSYVLSMSLTYAVVGAIVALLGANIQMNMQSPWAISLFSLIFIALALSMFGFYEFKLPLSWQAKIAGPTRSQRGGHYLGAAIMGCLSTLILSPCVTAPLIGVLTYIAQTQNVLLGTLTLFFLGLGMGTPLLLIGTSAGKWLPDAGSWMNAVKAFFGILLLGVAIYLMARIVPPGITMGLWATLLIFSGIYSGALTYSVSHQEKFWQGLGIILLSYGLLILVGMSMGATDPLLPLASAQTQNQNVKNDAYVQPQTLNQLEKAIKQARGKPIMLDFYADWCTSCKVMESTTFQDPQVKEVLSQFTVLKIDVTANNAEDKAIMSHFNVVAPPTFIFFNSKGEQLNALTQVGDLNSQEFLSVVNKIQ